MPANMFAVERCKARKTASPGRFLFCNHLWIVAAVCIVVCLMTCRVKAEDADVENVMAALPEIPVKRFSPAEITAVVFEDTWRLCLPVEGTEKICVRYVSEPQAVTCFRTGNPIPFDYEAGELLFLRNAAAVDGTCRNAVVRWPASRWQAAIMQFVEEDKKSPSMTGGLLFTGSSTAKMWQVAQSFPHAAALNRGFGGSQYADLFRFADKILGHHRPDVIIIYSGDNDINAGKTPEWVFADCAGAVERFRLLAPSSRIVILAIKPSGSRWEQYPSMQSANSLIENYAAVHDGVSYLDLGALLLDERGRPDPLYYLDDALHLSDEGYRRWSNALSLHIDRICD
ncbi:MAG TPA: hypothetical protein ENN29_10620 [Candidatus Hydrogenedentes bacterium]|nr:hypothetical protein [Candidatus Hydrogenedentota bacterium]